LAAGTDGSPDNKPAIAILRKIILQYPSEQTARLILSEALQDGYDDGKPRKGTQEMMILLQEVLMQDPNSSAANHLWIHAVEASPHPEQALHSADILASLAPNSGHMTHMPGHIFYRTGDYERAQLSFDLSESVDESYMRTQNVAVDDDWNYVHNLMYSIANLMEEGHLQQAAIVSGKLANARGHREDTLYPWSPRDAISRINPQLPIVLRTGDWPQVTQLLSGFEAPASLPNLQFLARSLTEFAQGMQKAESKDFAQAETYSTSLDAELWRFSQQAKGEESAKKKQPSTPSAPVNAFMSPDPVLEPLLKNLAVMSLELRASILVGKGRTEDAEKLFAQARQEEKDLGYREPPAFIRPVSEQEAVALMTAGLYPQARTAWQQALEDRPNSGFPLYGLALVAEKYDEGQQATAAYQEFLTAWKTADPNLPQVQHAQRWMTAHQEQSASAK
jgi:tetratricopeptide (TPR) repeat protein